MRTKQMELVCKECVRVKELAREKVIGSKMPKTPWYCDLCSDMGVEESGVYTSQNVFPVHSPLKNGSKRKRDDPYCKCWDAHVKRCHPHMQATHIPDRCVSPTVQA
eukprot:COSAG02_NODE_178_length_31091_cov_59.242482_22_plen_106_part_00